MLKITVAAGPVALGHTNVAVSAAKIGLPFVWSTRNFTGIVDPRLTVVLSGGLTQRPPLSLRFVSV